MGADIDMDMVRGEMCLRRFTPDTVVDTDAAEEVVLEGVLDVVVEMSVEERCWGEGDKASLHVSWIWVGEADEKEEEVEYPLWLLFVLLLLLLLLLLLDFVWGVRRVVAVENWNVFMFFRWDNTSSFPPRGEVGAEVEGVKDVMGEGEEGVVGEEEGEDVDRTEDKK